MPASQLHATNDTDGRSVFVTAPDGLRLHVREFGTRLSTALPVVCLPGLARNSEDFTPLAMMLSRDSERPRRVIAVDYRGRGLSEFDSPKNYTPQVELADVIAVLTALEVHRAVFVGTSRGGILTMLLASARPTLLAGAVLNDIGPVVEVRGLMRIKSYLGRLPQPRSLDEGTEILAKLFGSQFPKLGKEHWAGTARRTWREERGRLKLTYDAKLARTLSGVEPGKPFPTMWAQFDALAAMPLLVIRGLLSDLLTADTVEQMRQRRGGKMDVLDVPDEAHAPTLRDDTTMRRIAEFVRACEDRR